MAGTKTEHGVGINFTAHDLASGPIGLLAGNFQGLRDSFANGMPRILGGMSAMAGGLASITAGVQTFRTAFNFAQTAGAFETEMAAVRTITQATEEQFDALANAATEAGIQTQFAPAEAAGGLRTLAQQGLIAEDAISGLVPVLDFAAAGNIDVAEAAEVAMGVMNAYGMEVTEMTSVTDRLMRGTQISALSTNEFITVMGRAASSGQIFGSNLDDVIIALGSMRSAGIPATVATTSLGEAMRRLTTDRGAQEVMEELGVAAADSEGNLRSIIDVTRDFQLAIQDRTEAEQAQLVNQAFGVRGMQEFAAIANIQARTMRDGQVVTLRGAEAINHFREQLDNAGGTTEQFRRDRLATFAGQMTLLTGTIQTFQTTFGVTFGVIFRPIMLAITEGINLITRTWRSMSRSTQIAIGILTLVGAALFIVFGAIMTVVGGVMVLVAVLGELLLVAGIVAIGAVIAFAAIAAVIGLVIAAGYALYRAYQDNLGGLADLIDGWVSQVQLAWNAIVEIVSTDSFSDAISEELNKAENSGIRSFVMGVRDFVRRLQSIWEGFRDSFASAWQAMSPIFAETREAFSRIGESISGLMEIWVGAGNSIPMDSFQSFGAAMATGVAEGIRVVAMVLLRLVQVFSRVMQAIRAFQASPLGQILRGLAVLFGRLVWFLWRMGVGVHRLGQFIMRWLNPLSWLFRGLGVVWEGLTTGRATRTGPGETPTATPENPVDELTRSRRQREERDRTEAGTSRPAAAEAEGQQENLANALAAMDERRGRREGRGVVENRLDFRVNEESLGRVIQRLNLDNATGEGGVITDEFGYSQSVAP